MFFFSQSRKQLTRLKVTARTRFGAGAVLSKHFSEKSKLYPVLIAVLGVGVLALVLSRFNFQVSVEPSTPTTQPSSEPTLSSTVSPTPQLSVPPPVVSPSTTPKPTATSPAAPLDANLPGSSANSQVGRLRVSNQTEHPLRVALLPQTAIASEESGANPAQLIYSEPVHWDFAPQEGGQKGLLLSLPDGRLEIQQGDILVVFAQDGSRRYWGPFVVGKTSEPAWDAGSSEWQLVLQP